MVRNADQYVEARVAQVLEIVEGRLKEQDKRLKERNEELKAEDEERRADVEGEGIHFCVWCSGKVSSPSAPFCGFCGRSVPRSEMPPGKEKKDTKVEKKEEKGIIKEVFI